MGEVGGGVGAWRVRAFPGLGGRVLFAILLEEVGVGLEELRKLALVRERRTCVHVAQGQLIRHCVGYDVTLGLQCA